MMKLLITIFRHKWFLFLASMRVGEISLWRVLLHDLSKLRPSEFCGYKARFQDKSADRSSFNRAWLHHQNRNPHHPEYWVSRSPEHTGPIPMPEWAVREMIADWLAAGRAYEGEWPDVKNWTWLKGRRILGFNVHPETKAMINARLLELGVPPQDLIVDLRESR